MADALCGPSNALHTFQKHTQQDRTLQQDRLVSRAGSSTQGFRSPAVNAGILDADFESFKAGHTSPPPSAFFQAALPLHHSHTPLSRELTPAPIPAVIPAIPATPDWALDFQRLNLSSPTQQNAAAVAPSSSISAAYSMPLLESAPSFQHYMPPSAFTPIHANQIPFPQPMEAPQYNSAEFDAAFDAVAMLDVPVVETESLIPPTEMDDSRMATFEINKTRLNEYTISPEPALEQQETPRVDADELAQTAEQLLDNLRHDTSEKFAQSSFLALMRRLRDREIKVDGENLIESSTNNIANTTGEASSDIQEPASLSYPPVDIATRFETEKSVVVPPPPRPLTPEIDPPAPSLAAWKQRLLG